MAAPGPRPPRIPLPDDRFIRGLGYSSETKFDHGDIQHAWYNLGLSAQAGVPTQAQYEEYCKNLLDKIKDRRDRRSSATRARRNRIVLMAIKTISGHSRAYQSVQNPDLDFPLTSDLPRGKTWASQIARIAAADRPPLAAAAIANINYFSQSRAAAVDAQRRARRRKYYRTQTDLPSRREIFNTGRLIRMAEWEWANRHEGFTVLDSRGVIQRMRTVATYEDSGNALWHALGYQVHGMGLPGLKSPHIGLRAGRREKAMLYHFFTHVLHDPTHIRHRLYSWNQESTRSARNGVHGLQNQMDDWGEFSMLRCLATNDPDAGPPKDVYYRSIFQLISDFFRQEVLVFYTFKGLPGPGAGFGGHYSSVVFGKQAFGTDPNFFNPCHNSGQLMFVTDENFDHFDAVTFAHERAGIVFDTGNWDNNDRYGWILAPFTDPPDANPPVVMALTDIPGGNNGAPAGTPGHLTWGRPWDDPAFNLDANHPLVVCFENDRDAVETRPGFGNGRMPRMPNILTMGAWITEVGAPGEDSTPSGFEPWLMTSGWYRDMNDPARVLRGRYANKKAKIVADYTVELQDKGINLVRDTMVDNEQ